MKVDKYMNNHHIYQRIIIFLLGLFIMSIGIDLSCLADLGSSPISSVPWVLSMFTGYTIGEITIALNILFIAAQPPLLGKIYWREIIGQLVTLLFFGKLIDLSMTLLYFVHPADLYAKWAYCILGTIILAFGVFLCIKAKVFVAAGEGIVLALAFRTKVKFSIVKNCFDITLVIISSIISITEFHYLKGVGIGTFAAAILVGRWVQLYSNKIQFLDKWCD